MSVSRHTALVTGATSGIGRAIALALARQGRQVWATGRRADMLETLALEADTVRPVVADLTTVQGRDAVVQAVGSNPLDLAVHAAGLLGPAMVPIESYPEEDWYRVFETNVSSIHLLHQAIAPAMHRATMPTVIGVSSSVGRQGRAGWGMYAVSKYALEGWLQVLADEWGERGRVYSVNPGGTATDMRAAAMPEEDPSTLPTPEDIVPMFLHLAEPSCTFPSGGQFDARDYLG